MTLAWPQAQAGNVRAIAVTSLERSPTAPDVPAVSETLKGFEATSWHGVFVPAATPRPIVDKINAEVRRIFELLEVKARLVEKAEEEREAVMAKERGGAADTGFGGESVRSYVLQPYQLVKDLRTGMTSTSPGDVLDGDLDRFMAAALSQRVTGDRLRYGVCIDRGQRCGGVHSIEHPARAKSAPRAQFKKGSTRF